MINKETFELRFNLKPFQALSVSGIFRRRIFTNIGAEFVFCCSVMSDLLRISCCKICSD